MAATATQTQTPNLGELARLESDARRRITDAEAAEARLALDALGDSALEQELHDAQSDRRAAEDQLRQVELAREEVARREQQAEAEAEQARKQKELDRARKLQADVRKAAEQVDATAAALAAALAAYSAVSRDLEATLGRADENYIRPLQSAPEGALVYALRQAGVPQGMVDFAGVNARPDKLANSIPKQPGDLG
jgi:hypothetical protein